MRARLNVERDLGVGPVGHRLHLNGPPRVIHGHYPRVSPARPIPIPHPSKITGVKSNSGTEDRPLRIHWPHVLSIDARIAIGTAKSTRSMLQGTKRLGGLGLTGEYPVDERAGREGVAALIWRPRPREHGRA